MWTYSQSSGDMADAGGFIVGTGYAGHGDGVNNPQLQDAHDVGPLPQGLYSMGEPTDATHCGEFAIPLAPHDENNMFGRSGFFIHGDDVNHPGQQMASDGCIVLPPDVRHEIWDSGDHVLKVTA